MYQTTNTRSKQIAREVTLRDPSAFISLVGADGNGKNAFLPMGDSLLSRHLLLLGAPGTGKTNMMFHLFRNLRVNLTDEDVLVVFDPSGDYFTQFGQQGDIVFANDQRASDGSGEGQWNLFTELMDDDRLIQDATALCASLLADHLAEACGKQTLAAARDLLLALIVYLCRQEDATLRNNETLRALIDDFDPESMLTILDSLPELRVTGMYLKIPESLETQSVIALLKKAGREILQGRFGTEGSLGMRRTLRRKKGKTVFICGDSGLTGGEVYAALLDLCLQEVLFRSENEGNVYLLMDHIGVLPKLHYLQAALQFGRAKGLRLMLAARSAAQLTGRYGETDAQALLTAFGTVVAFALHEGGARTFVKELYGTVRLEGRPDTYLIGDEELATLQTGESIVATFQTPPFYFRMKRYGA